MRGGCLRLRGAEQVGFAADHRGNGFVGCAADLEQDLVRVAVWLCCLRPFAEVGVAYEPDEVFGTVGRDHIWPGRGKRVRSDIAGRRSRRNDIREAKRKLVQELGVSRREMERDGLRGVVCDDSVLQVAALRPLVLATCRSDDAVVIGHRQTKLEVALERGAEVRSLHGPAVRIADVVAESEGVRLATVGRRREGDGEVGHELGACEPAGQLVGDQAVAGHPQDRKRDRVVGHAGVDRVGGPVRPHRQRAAPMSLTRLAQADEHAAVGDRNSARSVPHVDVSHHLISPGIGSAPECRRTRC